MLLLLLLLLLRAELGTEELGASTCSRMSIKLRSLFWCPRKKLVSLLPRLFIRLAETGSFSPSPGS